MVSDTDLYKVEIFVDHQSHELRARIIEYPPPATVPTATCLSSSTPTELPTDTPVEATVVELLTNEGFWGFLAHVGGQPKANLRVDCPLRLEVLQQEAKIGRQLRIIVKPRSNPNIPFYYGHSKTLEWLDGEVPLPNDLAEVNNEFETVVCGPVANRPDLVEIEPPEDLPLHLRQLYKKKKWWVNIKSIPRGMAKGTKVRAKITGWKEGNTFPTIKILKILETPTGSV